MVADPPAPFPVNEGWPAGALELASSLQRQLAIGDRDWHRLKRQRLPRPRALSRPRRTASCSRLPRRLQRTSSKQ
jgi:hypothetical protein